MTVNFNRGNNFFVLSVVVAKAFSSFDAQRKRGPGEGWWGGGDRRKKGRDKKKHTTPQYETLFLGYFVLTRLKQHPEKERLIKH